MDRRLGLTLAAVPAGLVLGCATWLVAGAKAPASDIAVLDSRLTALPTRARSPLTRPSDALLQAIATPLSAIDAGASVIREMALRLEGLARSPRHTAALLSIDGGASQWLELGQSRSGVTLREVTGSGIVLDTVMGLREVKLGQGGPVPPGANTSAMAPSETPPPGYRPPPPPASAPAANP